MVLQLSLGLLTLPLSILLLGLQGPPGLLSLLLSLPLLVLQLSLGLLTLPLAFYLPFLHGPPRLLSLLLSLTLLVLQLALRVGGARPVVPGVSVGPDGPWSGPPVTRGGILGGLPPRRLAFSKVLPGSTWAWSEVTAPTSWCPLSERAGLDLVEELEGERAQIDAGAHHRGLEVLAVEKGMGRSRSSKEWVITTRFGSSTEVMTLWERTPPWRWRSVTLS